MTNLNVVNYQQKMRHRNGSFLLTNFGDKVGKRKMPTIKYFYIKNWVIT